MNPFPVVLSAPSGAGKTTVTKRLLQARADIGYSVSCTTRKPRAGEVEGTDYFFLSEPEFVARRDRGEFAEWAVVHGLLYGTLKTSVQRVLDAGRHVLMDIDVQGAEQFVKAYPSSVRIFLEPPSFEALLERLQQRRSEDAESLLTRLRSTYAEVQASRHYQYLVTNDDLDKAVRDVSAIIDAESMRKDRVLMFDARLNEFVTRLQQEIARRAAKI